MPLSQLKETRSRWALLSKVDQLGSIDFWNLTISLDVLSPRDTNGITVEDLQIPEGKIFTLEEYESRKKVLPLAAHEYTHFLDATSSLWGMHHLKKINACHEIDARDEAQFRILKNAYDYMRAIGLPNYYTTIDPALPTDLPWGYHITSGVRFDSNGHITDRPIYFMNFLTTAGERIVRSPLSEISLLEASAMAKEIEVRSDLAKHLQEPESIVEAKLVNQELMNYVYNSELTEYSACFHLLANFQDEKDLGITSYAAGKLCRIVLNAPKIAFVSASKNIHVYANKTHTPVDNIRVQRLKKALEYQDRGALFYFIVLLLPKAALKPRSSRWFMHCLEGTLKSIGLSMEKLKRGAYEEAEELWKELSRSTLQPIRELAGAGYENFKKVFPNDLEYPLEKLSLPPALHGDSNMTPYVFSSGEMNTLKSFDLENAYDELVKVQLRAENFAEACL